jgi:hypothetical protein
MAKRRKTTRAKRASAALSPAQARKLKILKVKLDAVYRNFWYEALGIVQPPRPPKVEPFLCTVGKTIDAIARILPPPHPPQ